MAKRKKRGIVSTLVHEFVQETSERVFKGMIKTAVKRQVQAEQQARKTPAPVWRQVV